MKRGLVLSGGAAWGLANIGVLTVLEREGFSFDCVAGSSMGAIVAGAYALGVPIQTIQEVAHSISLLSVAEFARPVFKDGFHGGLFRHRLQEILAPILNDARIGDAKIPFVCVAGRVKNKVSWENIVRPGFVEHFQESVETHVFADDVRMIDALLASSAIPVVFSPVKIHDDEFVDLVHFGAIPARQLHALHSPDVVIATDTNPRYGFLRRLLPAPWREFMERGHREIEADLEACDVVIEPRMPAPIFRFDRAKDFIASGQAAAEKQLQHMRLVLDVGHERLGKAHA